EEAIHRRALVDPGSEPADRGEAAREVPTPAGVARLGDRADLGDLRVGAGTQRGDAPLGGRPVAVEAVDARAIDVEHRSASGIERNDRVVVREPIRDEIDLELDAPELFVRDG